MWRQHYKNSVKIKMKLSTFNSRLAKSNTSKSSIAYQFLIEILNGKNEIRPCWVRGSGRFIQNADYTSDLERLLSKMSIDYKLTNTAKRGGKAGNLITITSKGRKQLKEARLEFAETKNNG